MTGGDLTLSTIVCQSSAVSAAEMGTEIVMLSESRGKYYGLGEVGSHVWPMIAQPRAVSEICDLLLESFEVDREQLERDILDFLAELIREGLIETDSQAPRTIR